MTDISALGPKELKIVVSGSVREVAQRFKRSGIMSSQPGDLVGSSSDIISLTNASYSSITMLVS